MLLHTSFKIELHTMWEMQWTTSKDTFLCILFTLISAGTVTSIDCKYTSYDPVTNVQYQLLYECSYECCYDRPKCCTVPKSSSIYLSKGAVIGIIIGCLVAAGLILAIVVYCCCIRNRTPAQTGGVIYQSNAPGVAIVGQPNKAGGNLSANGANTDNYPYFASQSMTAYNKNVHYTHDNGNEHENTKERHKETNEQFHNQTEDGSGFVYGSGTVNKAYI